MDSVTSTLIIWGPRIAASLAILLVTHLIAKLVERGIRRVGARAPWQKSKEHHKSTGAILEQAGKLAYWIIWLFGFLLALQPLELGDVVAPLNTLLNEIGMFLPNLIGAGAILIIGIALSKIVRGVVENSVGMLRIDRFITNTEEEGSKQTKASNSVANAAGIAVQVLVLLPIALAAIDVLGITAVTVPLRELMVTILIAVPQVVAAALLLTMAFVIGRWIALAAESFLAGLGVNEAGASIGLTGERFSISRVSYHVVLIAVMLFAFTEAARLLNFEVVSRIADEVVRLGGRILFGAAVIAIGFVIARITSKLIAENGDAKVARVSGYAIIALGIAMGLSFMGIATEIVTIAFASMLGAVAVASALAFGIGGRKTAHELLQEWKDDADAQ